MTIQPWIGTHDGKFHCDEVFAVYMLKKLPQFATHAIVRTRDPAILKQCEIVVDVGGIYDHQIKRYDHHQREFTDTMKTVTGLNFQTKLSSAGLVYAHYGQEVIAAILGLESSEHPNVDKIYDRLYRTFVESIDAIDNGIKQFDGMPRYQLASTLNSRVQNCNPTWNDPDPQPDKSFHRAKQIVAEEFEDRVCYLYGSWLPARQQIVAALERRKEIHPSGKILVFEQGGIPWKDHFFGLEEEHGLAKEDICLTIYEDTTSGTWRIQAIPVSETSGFDNRITLPWKGYRSEQLEALSGIPGTIFVHINGFIGGNKNKEGAIKMAEKTLMENGRWKAADEE